MKRSDTLKTADQLINGQRQADYGSPQENFEKIAARWSQILGGFEIEAWQVCLMMADLKIARLSNGPHADSFVDACGYLALASELAECATVDGDS
jgi:hypothetical protein